DDIESDFTDVAVEPAAGDRPRGKAGDAQDSETNNAASQGCAQAWRLHRTTACLRSFGNAVSIELKPAHADIARPLFVRMHKNRQITACVQPYLRIQIFASVGSL